MIRDVVDFRIFYETSLGHVTKRMIRRQLKLLWPNIKGQTVLGIGYAPPYLKPFQEEARSLIAMMPAAQGAIAWPEGNKNVVLLGNEEHLPFANQSIDRVLLVHSLEHVENSKTFLREVWRILRAEGELICIVPNRRGLWTRFKKTPFGIGRPYSGHQLLTNLRQNLFIPLQVEESLFVPPSDSKLFLVTASAWEKMGQKFFKNFSGVMIIKAIKQIYAGHSPLSQKSKLKEAVSWS